MKAGNPPDFHVWEMHEIILKAEKEYKNYYIHSIGSYRLLSLKRIKDYKIKKNKNGFEKSHFFRARRELNPRSQA